MFSWSIRLAFAAWLGMGCWLNKANAGQITPTQFKWIFDSLAGPSQGWSGLLAQAGPLQKETGQTQSRPSTNPIPPRTIFPPVADQKTGNGPGSNPDTLPLRVPLPPTPTQPPTVTKPYFVPGPPARFDPSVKAHPQPTPPPLDQNQADRQRQRAELAEQRLRADQLRRSPQPPSPERVPNKGEDRVREQLRRPTQEELRSSSKGVMVQEVEYLEEEMRRHQRAILGISTRVNELRNRISDLQGNVQKGTHLPITQPYTVLVNPPFAGNPPQIGQAPQAGPQPVPLQELRRREELPVDAKIRPGNPPQMHREVTYGISRVPRVPPMIDLLRETNEKIERMNDQLRDLEDQVRDLRRANQQRQQALNPHPPVYTSPYGRPREPVQPTNRPESQGFSSGNPQPGGPNHGPQWNQERHPDFNPGYPQPGSPNHGPPSFPENRNGPNSGYPQPGGPNHGPPSFPENRNGPNPGYPQPGGPNHGPPSFPENRNGPNSGFSQPNGPNPGPTSFPANPYRTTPTNEIPNGPNQGPNRSQVFPNPPNLGIFKAQPIAPLGFVLSWFGIPPYPENRNDPSGVIPVQGLPFGNGTPGLGFSPNIQMPFQAPLRWDFKDVPLPIPLADLNPRGINQQQSQPPIPVRIDPKPNGLPRQPPQVVGDPIPGKNP